MARFYFHQTIGVLIADPEGLEFDSPNPARATVVSALVADGALIELEAIACRR